MFTSTDITSSLDTVFQLFDVWRNTKDVRFDI